MKEGILNIYKEKGYTSFDVIAILRGKLKMKRLGHTGTLDPEAEGVLPVCIGRATKIADDIAGSMKTYFTTLKLGIVTDTQDHTGNILSECEAHYTDQEIFDVIKGFAGPYDQIPPMFSAIKINGQKLYDLARQGKSVERKPRRIIIHDIRDIQIKEDLVSFRVDCSKGTYIRTLCHDIGERLGCGAHMVSLLRERTGEFTLESALRISEVDKLIETQEINEKIIPVDAFFKETSIIHVLTEYDKLMMNGNILTTKMVTGELDRICNGDLVRVYDSGNQFVGLYVTIDREGEVAFKPRTVFFEGVKKDEDNQNIH